MDSNHKKLQKMYENHPEVFNIDWLNTEILRHKKDIDIRQEYLTDARGCLRALVNARTTLINKNIDNVEIKSICLKCNERFNCDTCNIPDLKTKQERERAFKQLLNFKHGKRY